MKHWDETQIADLSSKRYFITGATSGLGLETARILLKKNAQVTIAVRQPDKAKSVFTAQELSQLQILKLDISNIAQVREVGNSYSDPIDVLLLNAGIMATPFQQTSEGLENQFATNVLGHFLLFNLLANQIQERVVSVASLAHQIGNFGDGSIDYFIKMFKGEIKYSPWRYYGSTKLANLLFTYQANRVLAAQGFKFRAYAAHPGYSHTNLGLARKGENKNPVNDLLFKIGGGMVGQSAYLGSLPILYAATFPELPAGSYIGPGGMFEMRGYPIPVESNKKSHDEDLQKHFWMAARQVLEIK
jgi:NAD(P)-dependent dehydrogenase (short-subunit alcohol dehydrogenase family)